MNTQALGPFLGINNKLPDTHLIVPKVGSWLRAAENVEVTNAGTLVRRAVPELVEAMTGAHSLKMIDATNGYLVRAGSLYAITLPDYAETMVKVLSNDNPMSYAEISGRLYASNGMDLGRIDGETWRGPMVTPDTPTLTAIGGALAPGQYQVAISFARFDSGALLEEGGVSPAKAAVLSTTGGLRVTLPTSAAGATHVNVYLTQANGEVAYLAGTVAIGTTIFDCTALATGREAPVRFDATGVERIESPLPAGALFSSMGRLCSIVDQAVYVGLPFRPGYYVPLEGVIYFTAPVTLAIENQNGTYICADKTRWIPGDLISGQERIVEALPYGAVKGTAFRHPDKPLVGWFGASGIVLADAVGQVAEITDEALKVTPPASGVTTLLEGDYTRVVSCGWCVNLGNKAVTAFTGWDFTSTSGGYGTKSDGVYKLAGTGKVAWFVNLGNHNFGTGQLKHLPTVYAEVASETEMELTVGYVDDRGEQQAYTFPTRGYGENLQTQRFDTARGMRSTRFELMLSNVDGSNFNLAGISFAPVASTRRI